MAIKMKFNSTLENIANKAGMPAEIIAKATVLDAHGAQVHTTKNVIRIWVDGETMGSAMFKPEVLEMLMGNTLGAAGKKIFMGAMSEAISEAMDSLNYSVAMPDAEDTIQIVNCTLETGPASSDDGLPVPLRNADKLYQPVRGTDENSVYFAVALGKEANVGVRITSKRRVSFRIEGPDLSKFQSTLQGAGFKSSSQGHWSMHIECGDTDDMVSKTIGALLFSTGIQFDQAGMDVLQLKGKGK